MDTVLWLLALQGVLGAFDIVYHHEMTERLTWRRSAAFELKLHGMRNFLYGLLYLGLGWFLWQGLWAWLLGLILVVEVALTLWDFVIEDRTRRLPASERVTHTVLALNYGVILALLFPHLRIWAGETTALLFTYRGFFSWLFLAYALGVLFWAWRDLLRGGRLASLPKPEPLLTDVFERPLSVLVTGGTGLIGSRLCAALAEAGNQVTVLTRDRRRAMELAAPATVVEGLDEIPRAVHFDAIVNLAGEPIATGRWTQTKKREMVASRVELTRALVRYMGRCERRPGVLVSGSAIGFYGNDGTRTFTEDDPAGDGLAAELCRRWEAAAREAETYGVRVCLLRTGLVLAAHGGALGQMLLPFELGFGARLADGQQWMSWIHLDDLVRLIAHCIVKDDLSGPVNGTAPQPLTNTEFTHRLGHALRRPAWLWVPASVVRAALGEMADEVLLASQRVLPRKAEASGFRFLYPHADAALQAILR